MILKEGTKEKINTPKTVADLVNKTLEMEDWAGKEREHLWSIGLDSQNRVKYLELVSIGTDAETFLSTKQILRNAVLYGVKGIIVAHNHPSEGLEVSTEDITATLKLQEACKILDIILLDHVIVTKDSYSSMKAMGELSNILRKEN